MYSLDVEPEWDLHAWRDAARRALRAGVAPEHITWNAGTQNELNFVSDLDALSMQREIPRVPKEFLQLAGTVLCHRDAHRHGLLYRLLWRIVEGERSLLQHVTDSDVHRARELEKSVRRENHKMKAFVRFREVDGEPNSFVAWFEPEHFIVDRVAPFFARRFAGMRWVIITPYRSAAWDGNQLSFGAGGLRSDAPAEDCGEALWRTYYANIFNPARLNPRMMQQEMPQKYWKLLPEAHLLPELIRNAGKRVQEMADREATEPKRRIPAKNAKKPDET